MSQLLYLPIKSKLMTWPQTEVNLNLIVSPVGGNRVTNSCTEHAPLKPFLDVICPPLANIFDSDCARDGFSATINTVFIVLTVFIKRLLERLLCLQTKLQRIFNVYVKVSGMPTHRMKPNSPITLSRAAF